MGVLRNGKAISEGPTNYSALWYSEEHREMMDTTSEELSFGLATKVCFLR